MQYQATLADEQLIQLYLNGDSNALTVLVHLNKDKIYSSIYLIVQEKEKAEEIFGKVFVHIIDHLMAGKCIDNNKFLQWAIRIAHNMCLDNFKNSNRLPDTAVARPNVINMAAVGFIKKQNNHANHDTIRTMIEALPDEQRKVLVLRHYGDLGFKEIADIMQCSISEVLNLMRCGLNNLGKALTEKKVA